MEHNTRLTSCDEPSVLEEILNGQNSSDIASLAMIEQVVPQFFVFWALKSSDINFIGENTMH